MTRFAFGFCWFIEQRFAYVHWYIVLSYPLSITGRRAFGWHPYRWPRRRDPRYRRLELIRGIVNIGTVSDDHAILCDGAGINLL